MLTLLLTLTLLSGCGWHLRGVMPIPEQFKVLYLQSQAGNSFDRKLKLQLEFNGVTLTTAAEDGIAVLQIDTVQIEKRTLSVNSNGQVGEYELNGRLTARLLRAASDEEFPLELKARRLLTNDVNNVVGTASAEAQQRSDMESELVRKLLRQLQAIETQGKSLTPASDEAPDQPSQENAG
ncbi:LPS assembly lipoprotein LptE [Thalassolituus sp. LLYu03]|uniref:LPS-assembly lipoprotein LptE n=1 Tax=Thalassolituus sp. LLYu03 TaxID=3421656 RepID=UPI003D270E41